MSDMSKHSEKVDAGLFKLQTHVDFPVKKNH